MLRKTLLLIGGFLFSGCSLLTPLPPAAGLAERLAAIPTTQTPIKRPVVVYWNEHMVPFIEAQTDGDLAFCLGLVHAHLRLGQMTLYRHASQGRLSELFGPFMADIDHTIRILGFDRAVNEMAAAQPPETTRWLQRFVDGINYYQEKMKTPPHEFKIWAWRPEPWTIRDVLIISRLIGTDVNWLTYVSLLPNYGKGHFNAVWERILRLGGSGFPSFGPGRQQKPEILGRILNGMTRSGSNSLVIAGTRTQSGFPMMANDPHLGVNLPNMWIIAGLKSPSYHVVGLMFPGMPFVAVGRNPDMVWGGTNMRSASSDLYDVSRIPADRIRVEKTPIKVRWWRDREASVRITPWGPIITDTPLLKDYQGPSVALRWVGHTVTDEITALLQASRARTCADFRLSLATAGVSGQNLLLADRQGNISHVLAAKLPVRHPERPMTFLCNPADPRTDWYGFSGTLDLPMALNPPEGYLASANNPPVIMEPPIGYFYGSSDRIRRMRALMDPGIGIDASWLMDRQRDVYSLGSMELKGCLMALADSEGVIDSQGRAAGLWPSFCQWDGRYQAESRDALAFEAVLYVFAHEYYTRAVGAEMADIMTDSQQLVDLLNLELSRPDLDRELVGMALRTALEQGTAVWEKFASWGDMHRLRLNHTFSRMPLVGRRYRFGEFPADGSRTTLNKTAHRATNQRHAATYGSCARHISDLGHPDDNWFLLLGGQDGHFRSDYFMDQIPLWFDGRYIRVPLNMETVRNTFLHQVVLRPGISGE